MKGRKSNCDFIITMIVQDCTMLHEFSCIFCDMFVMIEVMEVMDCIVSFENFQNCKV